VAGASSTIAKCERVATSVRLQNRRASFVHLPGPGRRVYHQSFTNLLATVEEGAAMKRITVILSILVFALATTGLAMADAFTFHFNANGQTGSGLLFGTNEGSGVWSITGAIGTIDGSAVTGIDPCAFGGVPCGGVDSITWDDLLYYPAQITYTNTGAANVTLYGLMFTLANGDYVNLYYYDNGAQGGDICNSGGYCSSVVDSGGGQVSFGTVPNATFAPFTTPEPSTLALFGSGILGLAGILRRKVIG
jgi:hypothetical protein